MNKKTAWWLGGLLVLIVVGLIVMNNDQSNDTNVSDDDTSEMAGEYNLLDVTDGMDVRSINTDGQARGMVSDSFENGQYIMTATFENLPEPQNGDFYEGWVVRKGVRFNVVSTGELELENGRYVNNFESITDYTDHDLYVLTIEPNDGDPAPADHVLEGDII